MQNTIWKVSGTAVQGRGHIANNTPCQDKICSLRDNGITAIALADGAGSAELSHYGAEAAVKTICGMLCDKFADMVNEREASVIRTAIMSCLEDSLETLANELDCDIDDLSSTLIAAAADGEQVMQLHIGDGIAGYFKNGKLLVASYPDNGEYKNETTFITSPDASQRMRLSKGNIAGISGFVLMSDGAASSFFDEKAKMFVPLTEEIKRRCVIYSEDDNNEELEALFSETIRYNRTHDDCSMIMMCRPDEYFRGYRDLDEYDKTVFLGTRTSEGKENREKIFSVFSDREYVARSEILDEARMLGLKRRQTTGLLRHLSKDSLIQKVFPRIYKLTFPF